MNQAQLQLKLNLVRKFKKLEFLPNANHISKTIKDFSQSIFNKLDNKKKIVLRMMPRTSDREHKPKTSANNSFISTIHTMSTSPFITQTSRESHQTSFNLKINLKQFNPEHIESDNITMEKDHLENLKNIYNKYYLNQERQRLSKISRIILIDWLMQLSEQLQLTKQVLYNAVYYIDKYIEKEKTSKNQYQILGLAALSLASKLQFQDAPKITTFIESMDGGCSLKQLIETQQKILTCLKFKLNPPTLFHQFLLYLKLFKDYLQKSISRLPNFLDKANYQMYREIVTYLDLVMMQQQHLNYSEQKLILSLIYLTIKKNSSTASNFMNEFQNQSLRYGVLQKQFNLIAKEIANIKFIELKSTIEFLSKFLVIDFLQEIPRGIKNKISHQYVIRLQAYSSNMKEFILTI